MNNVRIALCLLVAAPLSMPAAAAPSANDAATRLAMRQADDVRALETVVRQSPRDGGAYIELAGAYVRAGRAADALIAYRRAMALDNVMLETRTGDAIWSHDVARMALAHDVVLTAR